MRQIISIIAKRKKEYASMPDNLKDCLETKTKKNSKHASTMILRSSEEKRTSV